MSKLSPLLYVCATLGCVFAFRQLLWQSGGGNQAASCGSGYFLREVRSSGTSPQLLQSGTTISTLQSQKPQQSESGQTQGTSSKAATEQGQATAGIKPQQQDLEKKIITTPTATKAASPNSATDGSAVPLGEEAAKLWADEADPAGGGGDGKKSRLGPLSCDKIIANHASADEGVAYGYFKKVKEVCGDLCKVEDVSEMKAGAKKNFHAVRTSVAPFNCEKLMNMPYADCPAGAPKAAKVIPQLLKWDYTLGGKVPIKSAYFSQVKFNTKRDTPKTWTKEMLQESAEKCRTGRLSGTYGVQPSTKMFEAFAAAPGTKNGTVLVIGSETPWVEACALGAGAKQVITLEYGVIHSEHPNVKTMLPGEFLEAWKTGALPKFDVVSSFSSLEHSGLGRYGDALNPWGDVLQVARSWCVTRDGGNLVVGLPAGADSLLWTAHRLYGPKRWPYIGTNWKQIMSRGGGVGHITNIYEKPSPPTISCSGVKISSIAVADTVLGTVSELSRNIWDCNT
ncbi:unnamed protein product [Amoebophrya sp. A120]|nr:unnamed protein product [Amoebophrya sp. A120]|eukprot:GSA120T00020644001.1